MSLKYIIEKDGSAKLIRSYFDLTKELSHYFPIDYHKDSEWSYQLRVESLSNLVVMCAQILTDKRLKKLQEQIAQAILDEKLYFSLSDVRVPTNEVVYLIKDVQFQLSEIARNFGKEGK